MTERYAKNSGAVFSLKYHLVWCPIKGTTSNRLRQEFKHLRSKLPTLWSRSCFMATVGTVSEATVRRYIEAQKGK